MSRRRASSPIGIGPSPPVRPSSASARSAYGLLDVIEITRRRLDHRLDRVERRRAAMRGGCLAVGLAVVGLDDVVGLALDGGLLVGLDLRRERVADRIAAA